MKKSPHIIIAGGGTGGHVFPAIAIANAIKELEPQAKILFIGAQDRLEMEKVPQAGYEIVGLPVKGLKRSLSAENIKTLFLLIKAINQTKKIFKSFAPDVVVGVGGYASAPALHVARKKNIPIVLQEQNSFPGVTNRIFGAHARKICAAYTEVYKYFPEEKVVITGNPVRKDITEINISRTQALEYFNLTDDRRTLLITGGSLGARTLNNAVGKYLDMAEKAGINLIWQTGKYYYQQIAEKISPAPWLKIMPFIDNMPYAYTAADLVISRAGAITISELSILGKAVIFVPSPNVAEDHQTKNAMALVKHHAAYMVPDKEAEQTLMPKAIDLIRNMEELNTLSQNIKKFARPNATEEIAKIVLNQIQNKTE